MELQKHLKGSVKFKQKVVEEERAKCQHISPPDPQVKSKFKTLRWQYSKPGRTCLKLC